MSIPFEDCFPEVTDGFVDGDLDFRSPKEDIRPVQGPRFPNEEFDSFLNEEKIKEEKWKVREEAFCKNLDLIKKLYRRIYFGEKVDWEKNLKNLEDDIGEVLSKNVDLSGIKVA